MKDTGTVVSGCGEVFVIQAGFFLQGVVLVIFIVLLVYWIISILCVCTLHHCQVLSNP